MRFLGAEIPFIFIRGGLFPSKLARTGGWCDIRVGDCWPGKDLAFSVEVCS